MGDKNCDLKSSQHPNARKLIQLYCEYQLEDMITDYTRIAVATNETGESNYDKNC